MTDLQRTLATERLRLLPQRAEHAAAMFVVLSDPRLYEHENAPPASLDALRQRYARLETRRSADGSEQWLNWVIELDGALVGYIQASVDASGRAGIAYELASACWGRGLAGEAVDAMLVELASHHGARELWALLKRSNTRSMRLLERRGFVLASAEQHRRHQVDPDEWRMERVAVPSLIVAPEAPRQADVRALIDALDAYQRPLYPPESHHGIALAALAAPNVAFAVARDAATRTAIGCGAVVVDGRDAELKRMYVDPARRGGGVARALLRFLEGAAIVRGATDMRLETGFRQAEALSFYRREGFARIAPFGPYVDDPNSVFMHKTLDVPA